MNRLFNGFLLALTLVSLPLMAQEAEEEETSQASEAAEAAAEQDAERESLEPGVPSAVLAQDVRRRSTSSGAVMDEMELGRTEITGNQELPKVLYIVPWKKSDPGDLMGKPVNTLLDEVLAPLDREEFIRQVDYYDDLYREEHQ
jgi:hypothetical protein